MGGCLEAYSAGGSPKGGYVQTISTEFGRAGHAHSPGPCRDVLGTPCRAQDLWKLTTLAGHEALRTQVGGFGLDASVGHPGGFCSHEPPWI